MVPMRVCAWDFLCALSHLTVRIFIFEGGNANMRVLIIGELLHTPAVVRAAREAGVEPRFLSAAQAKRLGAELPLEECSAVLAGDDHGGHGPLSAEALSGRGVLVAPLCGENIAAGISTISAGDTERLNAYFAYGGRENLRRGFLLLRLLAGEAVEDPAPPQMVPLDSIYTPEGCFYDSAQAFFQGEGRRWPVYVGMLDYRSRWTTGDMQVSGCVADSLERRGIGVIRAYTSGSPDQELGTLSFEEAADRFFCLEGRSAVGLLINFQFYGARAAEGEDMFQRAADCFAGLDIPVIRPAGLAKKTVKQWRESPSPYAGELFSSFSVPELQGMIEPVHISCAGEELCHVPLPQRVERLTGRVQSWLRLRETPNRSKRVAIFLHNAPCSGVEATVGQAAGLDAFESAVAILRRLRREGYQVERIPADGAALKKQIFDRKAYSDFRWTSAEDIASSGGVLYAMGAEEYESYYSALSDTAKSQMEAAWGPPPGEAMVLDGKILITGISFGAVAVLVQPKRGCFGAKCTGEVCRILQDPSCPPTHQFLATYWYLQHRWGASALVHLGTHGSLEYLPGKSSGLGEDCFPDIALGNMVNLYPYNASAVTQALTAKRRAYAVTLSHLPAPGKGLNPEQRRLAAMLQDYFSAREQGNGQTEHLGRAIREAAGRSLPAQAVLDRAEDFDEACRELQTMLTSVETGRRGSGLRALGTAPDRQWIQDYIIELWRGEGADAAGWGELKDPLQRAEAMRRLIDLALDGPEDSVAPSLRPWARDAREIAAGLNGADAELDSLIHALSGGFIRPTRGGDAGAGGRELLPTGRNLHGGAWDRIPTPAAYQRGKRAAEDLLALYRRDEGQLPRKAAVSMTSQDVCRTSGVQLSQVLYLLGVRPVWSPSGRVEGLECIPPAELGRPRIDVAIHISSLMRDAWPAVLTMIDRAVALAAAQDEPEEQNYVRANSIQIAREGEDGTGRIFGGKPGTYTSAVGLALKASAWKSEDDLAKYFIDGSSYLYGENRQGVRAPGAFAANVRQVELTCDISSSRRSDAVASSYSARVQGGFRLAAQALGSKKQIRQYMGESGGDGTIRVASMGEHVSRAISDTLLNALWREQLTAEGYQGAAELMSRLQNVFDTQCVCGGIPDKTLDAIVESCLLDGNMRRWFQEQNPHAMEEASRRFLELNQRGGWQGDPEVLRGLRRVYLSAEGDLEDGISGLGEVQAGGVDIVTHGQAVGWGARMAETERLMDRWTKRG